MNDHATRIFIIRHKTPGFEGVMHGVDFCNGRGSTSCIQDAAVLMLHGCTIEDAGARAIVEHFTAHREDEERLRKAARLQGDQAELAAAKTPLSPAWRALLDGIEERKREREVEERKAQKSARWKHAHNCANQALLMPIYRRK